MSVFFIILLILSYFMVGYVIVKLMDDRGLIDDDEFIFFLCVLFLPITLSFVGIKHGGNWIVNQIDKLL